MLTPNEKQCISEISEIMPLADLLKIGSAVTNNYVEITTKEDAVKALMLHESSLKSFLSKKKVTRIVLFKYLHFKNVNFNSNSDKSTLITLIINFWDQQQIQDSAKEEVSLQTHEPNDYWNSNEAYTLGRQFVEWFYPRMNLGFNNSEGPSLSVEDFWNDCGFTIFIPITENESHQSDATSAQETLVLLENLMSQYRFYFAPNLGPEGVNTAIEQHGLVQVKVNGTLHNSSENCVGIFEQIFGLIKNPKYANNYKIKKMHLLLRSNIPREPKMICKS